MPDLVKKCESPSIVASTNYNKNDIFIKNGTQKIDIKLHDYMDYLNSLGIGEVYLNTMGNDDTGFGCDLEIAKNILISLVITGTTENQKTFNKGLITDSIDAVATTNLFIFVGNSLSDTRMGIIFNNGDLTQWQ